MDNRLILTKEERDLLGSNKQYTLDFLVRGNNYELCIVDMITKAIILEKRGGIEIREVGEGLFLGGAFNPEGDYND